MESIYIYVCVVLCAASEECNNEEINWVKQKGTEEVFPDWDTTMDEFLLEQLNELNEEPETNNCGFE